MFCFSTALFSFNLSIVGNEIEDFIDQSHRIEQSKQHPRWEQEFNEEILSRSICIGGVLPVWYTEECEVRYNFNI